MIGGGGLERGTYQALTLHLYQCPGEVICCVLVLSKCFYDSTLAIGGLDHVVVQGGRGMGGCHLPPIRDLPIMLGAYWVPDIMLIGVYGAFPGTQTDPGGSGTSAIQGRRGGWKLWLKWHQPPIRNRPWDGS